MSSQNQLSGRNAQQQQEGGGKQATDVLTQVQSQQHRISKTTTTPATMVDSVANSGDNDKDLLATKQRIANRRWESHNSSAASTGNDGSTANSANAVAQKLNIANRITGSKGGSASAHQESSSIASFGGSACVNSSADGVLESKLAIVRKGRQQREEKLLSVTVGSTDLDNINSLSNTDNTDSLVVGQIEQSQDASTHQEQETATEQQEQNVDSTETNETTERQSGEQQQEIAYDAYIVDEEEQAEYRRQREKELLQEIERREYDELVRTLPRAEKVDPEELKQQQEQEERAAALRRRKLLIRRIAAVAVAIIVTCVVAVRPLKDDTKEPSREDKIAWIVEKASGDAIYNKSSTRYHAFRWIVDEDPMQLSVGGKGVRSFTIVERYVVVLFFLVTGGLSNWTDTIGFLGNSSVCYWNDPTVEKGIICDDSGSVRSIRVVEKNLYGTIPNELSALVQLEQVVLSANKLFGTIPSTLQKNTRLSMISLAVNYITGTIPDLSNLRYMQFIELFRNYLTGTLPGWVISSSELAVLNVDRNLLSGTIPRFASRDGLERVILSDNVFEGPIQQSLGSLSVLELLYLYGNVLSGSIPTGIGQATKLKDLVAYSNSLTGTIPTEIGNLQDLQVLALFTNALTGPIPTELGGLTDLVAAGLDGNHLTGTIPSELAALDELKYLYLHNNTLTGDVSELCFNQDDGDMNTGLEQLINFYTDCEHNILEPEVVCPCCTHCCNDMTGDCNPVKTLKEECQEKALQGEGSAGDDSGTVCECYEGGQVVSCKDSNCMYCNDADGSLCYIDEGTGMELGLGDNGRDEHVSLRQSGGQCLAAINGRDCASCRRTVCTDGYVAHNVDCSNLGYGAVLSACVEGDDPFYMLWYMASQLYDSRDFPIRYDCVE